MPCPLALKDRKESIKFSEFCFDGKAKGLGDLSAICLKLEIPGEPVVDFSEEPSEFTQFINQLFGCW